MVRLMVRRALALALFVAVAGPARAAEAYQVATISSLLAGGYDGNTTVGELLRHGNFGLGTFNGVDGEMMVLDGRVYRGKTDGRAELVSRKELTPFAVVVAFRPQGSIRVAIGQSLEQLEATLDALPYSASRILAGRIDGQRGRLALPLSYRRQDARRPCPRPDRRRRPGLAPGNLRPANQLSRAGSGSERQRRIDQGRRAPAVTRRWMEALHASAAGGRCFAPHRKPLAIPISYCR